MSFLDNPGSVGYAPGLAGGASGAAAGAAGAGAMAGLGPAAAALALGNIGSSLIDYGLNAKSASKAHDRSKNWATRKYQYELIALEQAGINPAYIFSDRGASAVGRSQTSAMQAPHKSTPPGQGIAQAAQLKLVASQAKANEAQAMQMVTAADLNRARAREVDANIHLSGTKAKDLESLIAMRGSEKARLDMTIQQYRDRPELLENELIQRGLPVSDVQMLMRAFEDISWSSADSAAAWKTLTNAVSSGNLQAAGKAVATFLKKNPKVTKSGLLFLLSFFV